MTRCFALLALLFLLGSCKKQTESGDTFVRGADVSFLPDIVDRGFDLMGSNGYPDKPLRLLRHAGVNTIRLRVWNHPDHPISSPRVVRCMADQCRGFGLKVMLSLHYSDTWADPGQQQKPEAWKNLNFKALRDSVYQFTFRVTKSIMPEYIQIGNEINGGFLWPEGSASNPTAFRQLLEAGISAARAAKPDAKIVLHYAGLDGAQAFFAGFASLNYDVAGLSYYPYWHGKDLDLLKQTLVNLKSATGREVMIVETAYPFTLAWNDQTHNVVGLPSQLLPDYPATPAGQRDFVSKIRQIAEEAGASGFVYWGAEWVSYKGSNATDGSSWENQALWDFNKLMLPAFECFTPKD